MGAPAQERVKDESAIEALSNAIAWHGRAAAASEDAAPVAPPATGGRRLPLPALRRLGRMLLDEAKLAVEQGGKEAEEEEPEDAEDAALWLEQMGQNYRDGNMDLADLADASSIPTLLRLLRVPDEAMVADVRATLASLATTATALPPPGEWLSMLTNLMEGVEPAPLQQELCDAARAGDTASVGLILAQPSPRTGPDARNANGNTALGLAALAGRTGTLRLLLQAKADPSLANSAGATALHQAAWAERPAAASVLLRAGAAVDAVTSAGDTALAVAAQRNSVKVAARLLDAQADPNARSGPRGETPLAAACGRGSADVARLLLAAGAATATQNAQGRSVLDWATDELIARSGDSHDRLGKAQKARLAIAEELLASREDQEPAPAEGTKAVGGELEVVLQLVIVEEKQDAAEEKTTKPAVAPQSEKDADDAEAEPESQGEAESQAESQAEPEPGLEPSWALPARKANLAAAAAGKQQQPSTLRRTCRYLLAWSGGCEVREATRPAQPLPETEGGGGETAVFAAPIVLNSAAPATGELLAELGARAAAAGAE